MVIKIKTPAGELPARVSFSALKELAQLTGVKKFIEVDKILRELKFDQFPKMCQIAFKHGAKKEDAPFDYDLKEIEEWLDDRFEIATDVIGLIGKLLNPEPSEESPGK